MSNFQSANGFCIIGSFSNTTLTIESSRLFQQLKQTVPPKVEGFFSNSSFDLRIYMSNFLRKSITYMSPDCK